MDEYTISNTVKTGTRGFAETFEYDLFTVLAPDGSEYEVFGGSKVDSRIAKQDAQRLADSLNLQLARKRITELERETMRYRVAMGAVIYLLTHAMSFDTAKHAVKLLREAQDAPASNDNGAA